MNMLLPITNSRTGCGNLQSASLCQPPLHDLAQLSCALSFELLQLFRDVPKSLQLSFVPSVVKLIELGFVDSIVCLKFYIVVNLQHNRYVIIKHTMARGKVQVHCMLALLCFTSISLCFYVVVSVAIAAAMCRSVCLVMCTRMAYGSSYDCLCGIRVLTASFGQEQCIAGCA